MLNNEFRIIGTVVSDFEEVGTVDFPKKKMMVEVERKGRIKSSLYPILVYGSNGVVDTSKSYKGKLVIVNGYVDIYKDYLRLVAQDVFVVSADTSFAEAEEIPVKKEQTLKLSDDDLPF